MKQILFLASLLLILSASSCGGGGDDGGDDSASNDTCSLVGLETKIIDGVACKGRSSVVKLLINNEANCTGTMITPTKVLTAAHCVYSSMEAGILYPKNSISISIGNDEEVLARSIDILPESDIVADIAGLNAAFPNSDLNNSADVERVISYLLANGWADMAVVRLDRSVDLPTMPVMVSSIPSSGTATAIYGFGLTDSGGNSATTEVYSGRSRIVDTGRDDFTQIYEDGLSNTCRGDSGGPTIVSTAVGPVVIGVTSLGFNDCESGEISVYAATAGTRIKSWLQNVAAEATYY